MTCTTAGHQRGLQEQAWVISIDMISTMILLILYYFKNRNKNSKEIPRQISRINHTRMFCSGVPAASCRTTDERDGQQSQWPDKSHFCELTLTQRVFWRLLLWSLPDSLIFVLLLKLWRRQWRSKRGHWKTCMKSWTIRPAKVLYATRREETVLKFIASLIFLLTFFSPPRRDRKMSGVYQLIHRNHTGTQCTQYNIIYTLRYCN